MLMTNKVNKWKISTRCNKDFLNTRNFVLTLTLNLIETFFEAFTNRADPGSTLFAYGNMIRYDPTLADMTSDSFVL